MEKAIGENAEEQGVKNWLNTGYAPLNKIISGLYANGLPQGRIVEMYGPSSSGKTVLTVLWAIEAQRQGGVAGFMDHEKALMVPLAQKLGLDTTFPRWIYKRPRTWEESNTTMMRAAEVIREKKAIPEEAPILMVLDSIAAAMPKSQIEDSKGNERGIDEYTMNDTTALARVTSTTLKAINDLAAELNVTMLYLNQIRMKPGVVYGDPTTTPGGTAMEFYASTRLSLGRERIYEGTGADKELAGQVIKIKCVKSKLTRPFQTATLRFMFNDDGSARFDPTFSLIEHLMDIGRLPAGSKPGSVTWINGKQYSKGQLAELIDKAGAPAHKELMDLLPKEGE
jgi:protein RecA